MSFYEKEEGTRPTLIVEVVSPTTRTNDVEAKVDEYHLARVQHYVILDRKKHDSPWQILGYEYAPGGYQPMELDAKGRLWLHEVGVWLEVEGQEVRCIDGVTGEVIPDLREARARLTQEIARADQLAEELAKLKASLGQSTNGAGKPQP